jgi:hypothetical protein
VTPESGEQERLQRCVVFGCDELVVAVVWDDDLERSVGVCQYHREDWEP